MTTTLAAQMLAETEAAFLQWLGPSYDLDALRAVLATAAVERLDGDPVWLLLVSGAGNAKTETVSSLTGADAVVVSTISSEGALLSATSRKESAKDATGGLLRVIGDRGILVIKDVTSILSMNRETRAAVLAALREVYDGRWERTVGTDGGRSLSWQGRITLVGAVTTAYDAAHGVIAAMGDRFALVRVDSSQGRMEAGRQALANLGHEVVMREHLADVVGNLLREVDPAAAELDDEALEHLLGAANIVTLARTAVERDYRGDVIEAHAPEAPTRFAKMLGQIVRGGLSIGMTEADALRVALRVAGDSVPPVRLAVLADVLAHPGARTTEVTERLQRPRSSVDRTLQELHLLGLVEVVGSTTGARGWHYTVPAHVDRAALRALITRKVSTGVLGVREGQRLATDVSGDGASPTTLPDSWDWPTGSTGAAS
jgi:hypothetical protein